MRENKKEKVFKVDKEQQAKIDAFKTAVENAIATGKYARFVDFEVTNTKDGYRMDAVLDYGDFKAKLFYNPWYLLCDYLDVEFDFGGEFVYSIYDIFNLFDIKDFNQYYYSSIELETDFDKYVKNILEMLNTYNYDIKKAMDNVAVLDSNAQRDYKNVFSKDKEESWREDLKKPLALKMTHPYFTSISDSTDSAKLLKKMKKNAEKDKLDTIYENRLLSYLESGNKAVNTNLADDKKQSKAYLKYKIGIDVAIFVIVAVVAVLVNYAYQKICFGGAFIPRASIVLGSIVIPVDINNFVPFAVSTVMIAFGIETLFGKRIAKRVSHNNEGVMRGYDKADLELVSRKKYLKFAKPIFGVGAIILGILLSSFLVGDVIGFYDDSVKFCDNNSVEIVEVANKDAEVCKILGEYIDEDQKEYKEYIDCVSYVIKSDDKYYFLEYVNTGGKTNGYVEKVISDSNKEVKVYKSFVDFENEVNPDYEDID